MIIKFSKKLKSNIEFFTNFIVTKNKKSEVLETTLILELCFSERKISRKL